MTEQTEQRVANIIGCLWFMAMALLILWNYSLGPTARGPRKAILITCEVENPSNCTTVREFDGQ